MAFTDQQIRQLKAKLNPKYVQTREQGGKELSYIEGWHAIAEANRIFGFDGWDRVTLSSNLLWKGNQGAKQICVYAARVRVIVYAEVKPVVREATGTGSGSGDNLGEAYDRAIKIAETDATKRALSTFGNPFGLALYDKTQAGVRKAKVSRNRLSRQLEEFSTNDHKELQTAFEKSSILKSAANSNFKEKRIRSKAHLQFVASQACLICGRKPADAHHITFSQPRAMALKVGDNFAVPLCRLHHSELHQAGSEKRWWLDKKIDPLSIAEQLWSNTEMRGTQKV